MRRRRLVILGLMLAAIGSPIGYKFYKHHALTNYVAKLRAKGEHVRFAELAATLSLNLSDTAAVLTNAAMRLGPLPGQITNLAAFHYAGAGKAAVDWNAAFPPWGGADAEAHTWNEASDLVKERAAIFSEFRRLWLHLHRKPTVALTCSRKGRPFAKSDAAPVGCIWRRWRIA